MIFGTPASITGARNTAAKISHTIIEVALAVQYLRKFLCQRNQIAAKEIKMVRIENIATKENRFVPSIHG